MKNRDKNMTPVPAQVSEEAKEDPRELADKELEGISGGQVVYGLSQNIEGSVPIIKPF